MSPQATRVLVYSACWGDLYLDPETDSATDSQYESSYALERIRAHPGAEKGFATSGQQIEHEVYLIFEMEAMSHQNDYEGKKGGAHILVKDVAPEKHSACAMAAGLASSYHE